MADALVQGPPASREDIGVPKSGKVFTGAGSTWGGQTAAGTNSDDLYFSPPIRWIECTTTAGNVHMQYADGSIVTVALGVGKNEARLGQVIRIYADSTIEGLFVQW